jgi:hypothetical protein
MGFVRVIPVSMAEEAEPEAGMFPLPEANTPPDAVVLKVITPPTPAVEAVASKETPSPATKLTPPLTATLPAPRPFPDAVISLTAKSGAIFIVSVLLRPPAPEKRIAPSPDASSTAPVAGFVIPVAVRLPTAFVGIDWFKLSAIAEAVVDVFVPIIESPAPPVLSLLTVRVRVPVRLSVPPALNATTAFVGSRVMFVVGPAGSEDKQPSEALTFVNVPVPGVPPPVERELSQELCRALVLILIY